MYMLQSQHYICLRIFGNRGEKSYALGAVDSIPPKIKDLRPNILSQRTSELAVSFLFFSFFCITSVYWMHRGFCTTWNRGCQGCNKENTGKENAHSIEGSNYAISVYDYSPRNKEIRRAAII